MNVRKVALFVEGATEQIFVRDFLAKWYDWDGQKVGFNCYALHSDNEYDARHPYGSTDSENYFQIFNVGNDNSVLSKMLDRSERLSNVGYTLIIGLRDMFSDDYHKKTYAKNKSRIIDNELNVKYIQIARQEIEAQAKEDKVQLHYAIMEVEAWILGMKKFMDQMPEISDPETDIYHPTLKLAGLLEASGASYDKHTSEVESLLSGITKDDYIELLESGRCQSFRTFVESLVG